MVRSIRLLLQRGNQRALLVNRSSQLSAFAARNPVVGGAIRSFTTTSSHRRKGKQDDHFLRPRNGVNHAPLTPINFLERTAAVFPRHTAIVYGDWSNSNSAGNPNSVIVRQTWSETFSRCRQIADSLSQHTNHGDVVGVFCPNTPAFVELHHAVSMAGCVLNPVNIRLDPPTISYIIQHAQCKVLFVDSEFLPRVVEALKLVEKENKENLPKLVVEVPDVPHGVGGVSASSSPSSSPVETVNYEHFLGQGNPNFHYYTPTDEWEHHAVNYTKGV